MARPHKFSESEWELMLGIWAGDVPVTVRELHTRLYPNGEKAYTTVQTTMNILVDKKYLKRKKIGMVNFYTPTVSRDDAKSSETMSLVSRLFHNSFGSLANHLVNSGKLSSSDLDKLKTLIEEEEKKINKGE